MSWTTQETITVGGDTVLRQLGDQVTDLGHRVVLNGTPGTQVPLNRIAFNGDYRGIQQQLDLSATLTPLLFKAVTT